MDYLRQILGNGNGQPGPVRLDRAALELASIHFPGLTAEPFLDRLNEMACSLGDRLRNFNDGRDFVEKAELYLFGELGFHGNETDFFDPLNSCLNQVLERRTGIPITLSVMYMEIARRLRMPVYGIGLPRHFVLEFNDGNYSTFIDPFHGGCRITPRDCYALAGSQVADPSLLRRVTPKQIVMRMLQNLDRVYMRQRNFAKSVATLDLMIFGAPETAAWYKRRGLLSLELGRYHSAQNDLRHYLALEPEASDRPEIVRQMTSIHHWMARVS